MATVRAVQYYRVSPRTTRGVRTSEDAEADSIEKQERMAQGIAGARGWVLIDPPYVDQGISASKKNVKRPAYERMVSDYRAGKFEAIICYDLDRLTRQPRQLEDWIDAAEQHGLQLVTLNGEADLSTDGGRMYARIKAAVARGEVERTGKRIRDANEIRAQKGGITPGFRPFGYADDQKTVIEAEAALITDAMRRALAGESFNSIAREWNAHGIRSVRAQIEGKPPSWSTSSIKQLLLNPRYAGLRSHRGEVVGKAQWPAIVSEDEQEALRNKLHRRQGLYGGPAGRQPAALLTRIATCGVCGGPIVRGTSIYKDTRRKIYTCKHRRCATTPAEALDAFIGSLVVHHLADPRWTAELLERERDPELGKLQTEKANVEERLVGLAEDYAEGVLTRPQMVAATGRLRERLDRIDERLRTLSTGHVLDGLDGTHDAERAKAVWEALSLERKRAVVALLLGVKLHPRGKGSQQGFMPHRVEWRWRRPKA